jgi:DNA-binding LytR/AlgR family response regulator
VRGAEGAVTLESLNNLENILSVRVHKSFIVARFR